jgi:hypothetical protein
MAMESNPQPQDFDERRDAERVDVAGRYSMRLDPGDGREPIACSLLDFSVTGARLKLPEDVALPDIVQILIGSLAHNSKIVWRKDMMIGVDFIDEHHDIV